MSVKHIDLSYYVEVEKGARVRLAIDKMQTSRRKCALIMDRGALLGIFTAHDIARRIIGRSQRYGQAIEAWMTADPLTIDANLNITDAIRTLNAHPHRYIPVVNQEKRVLGTLTHYAIIKYISDYFPEDIYNVPPEPDQVAGTKAGA